MKDPEVSHILIIDDDKEVGDVLSSFLKQNGFEVTCSDNSQDALGLIQGNRFDIVITDIRMPDVDGIDILKQVKKTSFETEVIIITGYGTIQNAISALKEGASDFLLKPVDMENIFISIQKIQKLRTLRKENIRFRERIEYNDNEYLEYLGTDSFIGDSSEVKSILGMIEKAAEAPDSGILITGESGTGKELAANLIHRKSNRSKGPFITVNCSGFPPGLIESELFGHVKGAFTGAEKDKKGLIELADKGTLLLDEIGDMPQELQGRLLRVLEDQKVRKVGGQNDIPVDFRVISATNRDLGNLVTKDKFRQDLFYRLNIMHIPLPPLRGREHDIRLLASHYVEIYSNKLRKCVEKISPEVMTKLTVYQFPGNVRELKNMIEQAVILSNSKDLPLECFPRLCMENISKAGNTNFHDQVMNVNDALKKDVILRELNSNKWHLGNTAKALGIGYDALRYRMDKFNISKHSCPK